MFQLPVGYGNSFIDLALDIFRYQARHNITYRNYLQGLVCDPDHIQCVEDIPFLPIRLYRSQRIQTGVWKAATCFQSSGTTDLRASLHFIDDLSFYEDVAQRIFEQRYGSLTGMLILALLPDYLSRPGSSLVYMLRAFMNRSAHPNCGFFMHEEPALAARIRAATRFDGPKQLWSVPIPLARFSKNYPDIPLDDFTIITTGGRKRHRSIPELSTLFDSLQARAIDNEYGMTELLSQAYARRGRPLVPPPWMKVLARHADDPLHIQPPDSVGPLNIIDLAAMHSCAFIATEDQGRVYTDGSFECLGRVPAAPSRGCHLLADE